MWFPWLYRRFQGRKRAPKVFPSTPTQKPTGSPINATARQVDEAVESIRDCDVAAINGSRARDGVGIGAIEWIGSFGDIKGLSWDGEMEMGKSSEVGDA